MKRICLNAAVAMLLAVVPALANDPPKPTPPAPAEAATAPTLNAADLEKLADAVKVIDAAQTDATQAQLIGERAKVQIDRGNIYLAAQKLYILAKHQMDPDLWDVQLQKTQGADGAEHVAWSFVKRPQPASVAQGAP